MSPISTVSGNHRGIQIRTPVDIGKCLYFQVIIHYFQYCSTPKLRLKYHYLKFKLKIHYGSLDKGELCQAISFQVWNISTFTILKSFCPYLSTPLFCKSLIKTLIVKTLEKVICIYIAICKCSTIFGNTKPFINHIARLQQDDNEVVYMPQDTMCISFSLK